MNTKLHAVADAKGRPIGFFMSAGQVSDYTGAAALLGSLPKAGWLLADGLWFGIQPISAGVFGVPVGLIVAIAVSRITRPAPALPLVRSEM